MEPEVRVTVAGKPALTVTMAAARYGLAPSSMRAALTRLGDTIAPAAMLDARTPLYLTKDLDAAMRSRPGRGARTH